MHLDLAAQLQSARKADWKADSPACVNAPGEGRLALPWRGARRGWGWGWGEGVLLPACRAPWESTTSKDTTSRAESIPEILGQSPPGLGNRLGSSEAGRGGGSLQGGCDGGCPSASGCVCRAAGSFYKTPPRPSFPPSLPPPSLPPPAASTAPTSLLVSGDKCYCVLSQREATCGPR